MKRIFHACAAIALATLAQPAAANCGLTAAPPAPGADAAAEVRVAHDLATLYYPEDMIMAVVERQSRTAFEQGVRQSPNGERIVREMPGLVEAGYQATMRVMRPCVAMMVPNLQARAADVLARRMTVPHMRDVAAFYRSDAGRATMAAILASLRPPQPRLRPDGTPEPMTREDISGAVDGNFMSRLTPAQALAVQAFTISPHGRAFTAVTPELEQLSVNTINSVNSAAQADIEAAVGAAVEDYFRRNPPPRRGS